MRASIPVCFTQCGTPALWRSLAVACIVWLTCRRLKIPILCPWPSRCPRVSFACFQPYPITRLRPRFRMRYIYCCAKRFTATPLPPNPLVGQLNRSPSSQGCPQSSMRGVFLHHYWFAGKRKTYIFAFWFINFCGLGQEYGFSPFAKKACIFQNHGVLLHVF